MMRPVKRRKSSVHPNNLTLLKVLRRKVVIAKIVMIRKEKRSPKEEKGLLLVIGKLRQRRRRSDYIMMKPSKDSLDGYPGVMMVSSIICPHLISYIDTMFTGEILAAPSGVLETDDSNKMSHCTWVYTRVDMSKPVLCLPTKDKYTTAVRFNPQLFKLRPLKSGKQQTPVDTDKPWLAAKSLFALPYRMVYAVATQNAIMFYDTQQVAPWGRVSNVHYTGLTDLAWSPCGNILFASSSDGYCSIVSFAPGEIGELYSEETASSDSKLATDVKEVAGESKKKSKSSKSEQINIVKENKSNAKRLQFVTLSSPKANKKAPKPARVVETKEGEEKMEMNLDCDEDSLGVQRMETDDNDDLRLVLEETEPEPFKKAAVTTSATTPEAVVGSHSQVVDGKKRVPLTTLMTQGPNTGSGAAATPEKGKGRRVNLITLSSPKPKA